jgi:hypothetical protein
MKKMFLATIMLISFAATTRSVDKVIRSIEVKSKEKYLEEAQGFEKKGDFAHAAPYYEKANNKEKAKEMYLLAAQMSEFSSNFAQAASYYGKAGNQERAKAMYFKQAQLSEEKSDFPLAAFYHEKSRGN